MVFQLRRHVGRHLVGGRFGDPIRHVADVLQRRPMGDVHDQAASPFDHARGGELTGAIVSADAGREHRVPSPQWLLPERLRPGERPGLHHLLVTTPHAVDEDVDRLDLADDEAEHGVDLLVLSMIAAQRGELALASALRRRRPAGHVDSRAAPGKLVGDAPADPSGRPGHHRGLSVEQGRAGVHGARRQAAYLAAYFWADTGAAGPDGLSSACRSPSAYCIPARMCASIGVCL